MAWKLCHRIYCDGFERTHLIWFNFLRKLRVGKKNTAEERVASCFLWDKWLLVSLPQEAPTSRVNNTRIIFQSYLPVNWENRGLWHTVHVTHCWDNVLIKYVLCCYCSCQEHTKQRVEPYEQILTEEVKRARNCGTAFSGLERQTERVVADIHASELCKAQCQVHSVEHRPTSWKLPATHLPRSVNTT
jgi:hypothetical protein